MPIAEILLRLGLAVLLGGAIGLDREWRRKPAGLRTHMLVALAAAAFTVVTLELFERVQASGNRAVSTDPLRVVEAITAGVAFLGAGAIIQSRGNVRGLTTGAGIWLAGAIGFGCGSGHYAIAAVATAMAVIILTLLGWIAAKVERRNDSRDTGRPSD
ncbi:MAG: MgtC/SapB family protein [Rhodospirillaceae bacterium]|nr:MgtC/SapB family protein [Rhodospirillaceae bacterium]